MGYKFDAEKHLHSLDDKPLLGASTIVNCLSKEALIPWSMKIAFEYAKKAGELTDEVIKEAKQEPKRQAKEAAEKGTELHGLLEDYVKECLRVGGVVTQEYEDSRVQWFSDWAVDNIREFVYSEAHTYSPTLWVGGISDCGAILKDGRRVLIDFKSSREAYESQFFQIAVYDRMLKESGLYTSDGVKTGEWEGADVYMVFPFRASPMRAFERYDVETYRSLVEGLVGIYKVLNNK